MPPEPSSFPRWPSIWSTTRSMRSCAAGPLPRVRLSQRRSLLPILTILDDIVAAGIVMSLARPGGNTTGISFLATELDGKRQEILMELVPSARRMAALVDANATAMQRVEALRDATRARDVELAAYV